MSVAQRAALWLVCGASEGVATLVSMVQTHNRREGRPRFLQYLRSVIQSIKHLNSTLNEKFRKLFTSKRTSIAIQIFWVIQSPLEVQAMSDSERECDHKASGCQRAMLKMINILPGVWSIRWSSSSHTHIRTHVHIHSASPVYKA